MSMLKGIMDQLLHEMEEEKDAPIARQPSSVTVPPMPPPGNPRARLTWATTIIAPQLEARQGPSAQAPFDILRELAIRRDERRGAYAVYVLLLDDGARHSRQCTNTGQPGMPCVYVGETSKTVEARYEDHLAGYKSRAYIRQNIVGLLPGIHERYNPIPDLDTALAAEAALAEALRLIGCTVFGGH